MSHNNGLVLRGLCAAAALALTFWAARPAATAPAASGGETRALSAVAAEQWTLVGPRVGLVNNLAVAPSSPSVIYASVDANGMDANDKERSGVYKSVDAGATWAKTGFRNNSSTTGVMSLTVDPTNPSVVYAGTFRFGVFKSTDGGDTWAGPFGPQESDALSIAIDPATPSTLYAAFSGRGVHKSTNGGLNWTVSNNGIQFLIMNELRVDPANPSVVYAVGGPGGAMQFAGVHKSTDHGANWVRVNNGLPATTMRTLAIDPTSTSVLYVGTTSGVFRSVNGGADWGPAGTGLPAGAAVDSIAVNPANPSTLFANTGGTAGLYKSTDSGATWSQSKGGNTIGAVAIDPAGLNVYAGSAGLGVFKSTDGGTQWQQSSEGFPLPVVRYSVVDPSNPLVVYLATNGGVYKSTDGGATWGTARLVEFFREVTDFAIDPQNTSNLYAALNWVGVMKSADGGLTWSHVLGASNNAFGVLALAPSSPQTLLAGRFSTDLFRSTDGGAQWSRVNSLFSITGVDFDPHDASVAYAVAHGILYKSTNGGTSWARAGLQQEATDDHFKIYPNPVLPQTLYAVFRSTTRSVRRSTGGGLGWEDVGFGLPQTSPGQYNIRAVAVDPTNGFTLYATAYGPAADGGGVYRSLDGGDTWSLLYTTLDFVSSVGVDATGKKLYAGTDRGAYAATVETPPTVSVGDVTVTEGAAGATADAAFDVTIRGGNTQTVSVDLLTFGVTALDGEDFQTVSTKVTFAPGETSKTVVVPVKGDAVHEGNETFRVELRNPVNIHIGDGRGVGTILDDEPVPSLSVGDLTVTEGDSGRKDVFFTVTLSGKSARLVHFTTSVTGGSATHMEDFHGNFGGGLITPGQTSTTIRTEVVGDTITEADETYFLDILEATEATVADGHAVATILDDETAGEPPTLQLSAREQAVSEGAGSVTVTVTRSGDASAPVTVGYRTRGDNGSQVASERSDYTLSVGTLQFAAGENTQSFKVLIADDAHVEGVEFINVELRDPTGGASLGAPNSGLIRIDDNDTSPSGTNPVDASEFFVRQHYADFFNREPDRGGLDFWTGGIESCGADAGCRFNKRVDTSAAFFLSIEFQETGFLVHRMYKAAYGEADGSALINNVPTPIKVPVVRLGEFLPDTQRIGQNVIVGTQGWPERLNSNKAAFALEFVQRPRFTILYPSNMSPEEFVGKLITNAGITLDEGERAGLVNELNGNNTPAGRASVLRKVAEDAELVAIETNKAFVLMQYFGYLRRNPNDPQDTDHSGYHFWLTKLDQFNGDWRAAQMVFAFIDSFEYRGRFGP